MNNTATGATAPSDTDDLTPDQRAAFEKLADEHPGKELRLAVHPFGHWMIFRIPTEAEYRIYKAKSAVPAEKDDATNVLLSCVLFPAPDELKKEIASRPALRDHWASEVVEGAGVNKDVKQKKLSRR